MSGQPYLPGGICSETEMVERMRVVELPEVAKVQEGEQKAQALPHPGVKAVDRDVHVVCAFAERLQPDWKRTMKD